MHGWDRDRHSLEHTSGTIDRAAENSDAFSCGVRSMMYEQEAKSVNNRFLIYNRPVLYGFEHALGGIPLALSTSNKSLDKGVRVTYFL